MIKLIASDMDGTLLNSKHQLPANFWNVFERLDQLGVLFTIASGRSYSALIPIFKPYAQRLNYICDNGAFVMEENRLVYLKVMDPAMITRLIAAGEKIPGIKMLFCGLKGTYHLSWGTPYDEELQKYYCKTQILSHLSKIRDDIFKVSFLDLQGSENNCYPALKSLFENELSIMISGPYWTDIMAKGTEKGAALQAVQEKLGIAPEETMAFGDYFNDVSMLQRAKYSFVMANASADMKQFGNYRAKSNDENGVIEAIKEWILK